jgi:hypothetical protein
VCRLYRPVPDHVILSAAPSWHQRARGRRQRHRGKGPRVLVRRRLERIALATRASITRSYRADENLLSRAGLDRPAVESGALVLSILRPVDSRRSVGGAHGRAPLLALGRVRAPAVPPEKKMVRPTM